MSAPKIRKTDVVAETESKPKLSSSGGPQPVDYLRVGTQAWLVKVPRYLSDEWKKHPNEIVGHIRSPDGDDRIKFVSQLPDASSQSSSSSRAAALPAGTALGGVTKLVSRMAGPASSVTTSAMPTEHEIKLSTADSGQMLLMALEDRSQRQTLAEDGRVSLVGRIAKRAEIRPLSMDDTYLKMKIAAMKKASQPTRQIITTDVAETKFKPNNIHRESLNKQKSDREGAKAVRENREVVMNKVFEAFTTHEYYRLQDLQQLTKQPPGYLKEILNDIAIYHTRPPHRATWQLKDEYRAYTGAKALPPPTHS